ncbi:MAG: YjbH domain-containing protein [Bacteroidaceae bacterium]|nr:YjbH domain-containing protein [Bacteroidaceae bacterium]
MKARKQLIIRKIILCCIGLFPAAGIFGQQHVSVTETLCTEGFEDIRATTARDTLYLAIEDRAHRGTFRGAAVALQRIGEYHNDIQAVEMVLTDYKSPQLIVHASKREGTWDVSVDRKMEQALRELQGATPTAPSTGKIDITVFPMVSLVNNKLDHLFDYCVRIAPAFAATLWKGARITIQPIFPILHNLDEDESTRYIQIGNLNLRQEFLSTARWQASATAGFFHAERAGLQAQVTFHALPGLDLSVDAGYTYGVNYTRQKGFGFIRESQQVNFMARASYYEPHTRLQIQLQGGRFLYGDYGGRLDVTRHFGEYAIGLYGILTAGEHNAGFHFAIPMGGKRQKRSTFLRLRLPEYFAAEYSMQSFFRYWEEKMGQEYVTQPDQNRAAHHWEPAYVEEYIRKMLNGTFK